MLFKQFIFQRPYIVLSEKKRGGISINLSQFARTCIPMSARDKTDVHAGPLASRPTSIIRRPRPCFVESQIAPLQDKSAELDCPQSHTFRVLALRALKRHLTLNEKLFSWRRT